MSLISIIILSVLFNPYIGLNLTQSVDKISLSNSTSKQDFGVPSKGIELISGIYFTPTFGLEGSLGKNTGKGESKYEIESIFIDMNDYHMTTIKKLNFYKFLLFNNIPVTESILIYGKAGFVVQKYRIIKEYNSVLDKHFHHITTNLFGYHLTFGNQFKINEKYSLRQEISYSIFKKRLFNKFIYDHKMKANSMNITFGVVRSF